jgi:hypothetical protein
MIERAYRTLHWLSPPVTLPEVIMKLVAYFLAAALALVGFIFLIGSQGAALRLIIGAVLILSAGAIVYLTRVQPQVSQTTTVQKIDLTGDVRLEEMRCRSCNSPLNKEDVEVKAGAIFVHCSYCGATYQLEEEPKW